MLQNPPLTADIRHLVQNMSGRLVVALDLDGVSIKLNLIKYKAMLAIVADYPDKLAAIAAYILGNEGVVVHPLGGTAERSNQI